MEECVRRRSALFWWRKGQEGVYRTFKNRQGLLWIWSTDEIWSALFAICGEEIHFKWSSCRDVFTPGVRPTGVCTQMLHLIWPQTPWLRRIRNWDDDHYRFHGPTRAWSRLAGCCLTKKHDIYQLNHRVSAFAVEGQTAVTGIGWGKKHEVGLEMMTAGKIKTFHQPLCCRIQ